MTESAEKAAASPEEVQVKEDAPEKKGEKVEKADLEEDKDEVSESSSSGSSSSSSTGSSTSSSTDPEGKQIDIADNKKEKKTDGKRKSDDKKENGEGENADAKQKNPKENKKLKRKAEKNFNGRKARRESSPMKKFIGDHIEAKSAPELIEALQNFESPEEICFADHCSRLTNRNHMEDCNIVVTTNYLFIFNNRWQHILTEEPIRISDIIKIETSKETDNTVVIILPEYKSELLMTSFKIELMLSLRMRYKAITSKYLRVSFRNVIEFEVNEETIFEFDFVRANDGVRMTLFIKAKEESNKP